MYEASIENIQRAKDIVTKHMEHVFSIAHIADGLEQRGVIPNPYDAYTVSALVELRSYNLPVVLGSSELANELWNSIRSNDSMMILLNNIIVECFTMTKLCLTTNYNHACDIMASALSWLSSSSVYVDLSDNTCKTESVANLLKSNRWLFVVVLMSINI